MCVSTPFWEPELNFKKHTSDKMDIREENMIWKESKSCIYIQTLKPAPIV